jgi:hypothetical protein
MLVEWNLWRGVLSKGTDAVVECNLLRWVL